MPYYNALNKISYISNHTSKNRSRLTWSPVSGTWGGATVTPDYYRVYEGGYMSFTCSYCKAKYSSSSGSHPATCSACGYSGPDWDWLPHEQTRTNVSGTEYTVRNIDGYRPVWIAAHAQTGQQELWSEPQFQYATAYGSVITSGSTHISLQDMGDLVLDNTQYSTEAGTVGLNETVYNNSLNPFSKSLPGYDQRSDIRIVSSSYDFYNKVADQQEGSWYISGSNNSQLDKSASLLSFRGYTDNYECGVTATGSSFFFVWGDMNFYPIEGGTAIPLHPTKGILDTVALSGSCNIFLFGTQSRFHYDSEEKREYTRRIIDDITVGGTHWSTGLAYQDNTYPGIIIYVPDINNAFNCYVGSSTVASLGLWNSGSTMALQIWNDNDLPWMPSLPAAVDHWSGSRIYPVIFYHPVFGSGKLTKGGWSGWKGKTSTTKLADNIFTFDDIYIPISTG